MHLRTLISLVSFSTLAGLATTATAGDPSSQIILDLGGGLGLSSGNRTPAQATLQVDPALTLRSGTQGWNGTMSLTPNARTELTVPRGKTPGEIRTIGVGFGLVLGVDAHSRQLLYREINAGFGVRKRIWTTAGERWRAEHF